MNRITLMIAISSIIFNACNTASSSTKQENNAKDSNETSGAGVTPSSGKGTGLLATNASVELYLEIKNALASDDAKRAATNGKSLAETIKRVDTTNMNPAEKKVFHDVQDDIAENADHIGTNADKIDHQREHFQMLSKDIYDLVKVTGSNKKLYNDFCPMYNNRKGAAWLSETKDIKNPYLGKKMETCGNVKEEIQ